MQISSWQTDLQKSIRDPVDLLNRLGLPADKTALAEHSLTAFPVRVPPHFLKNIRSRTPDDPLLRQVLPLIDEDREQPDFTRDPLNELASLAAPGILHKYHGRALMITTGACAIHCRYCFRRHFPYGENHAAEHAWTPALAYLRNDSTITEVILSGGDPFMLADEKLEHLLRLLVGIRHLRRLRVHTRMPTAAPGRVTNALLDILKSTRLPTVLVSHCNHPGEIDAEAGRVFARIRDGGITLLNQAVLLQGVNDDAEVLISLSERLFEYGALPYYLHLLDRVAGAGHFEVTIERAQSLHEELRRRLPGYLVPRLVREIPGAPYKIPVL